MGEKSGDSTSTPLRVVELLGANPFITTKGAAEKLGIAFTTAQRAIQRLQRIGILKLVGDAKRDRVFCARTLLDILEVCGHRRWCDGFLYSPVAGASNFRVGDDQSVYFSRVSNSLRSWVSSTSLHVMAARRCLKEEPYACGTRRN